MKTPKIVNAMNHVDSALIEGAERTSVRAPVWRRWGAAVAAFAVLLSCVLIFALSGAGTNTVIGLDVNPSIELEIDKNERVVRAEALNPDGERVLAEMELAKVDVNVAVNAIIGSMLKNGYLTVDKNSILVSVNSTDEKAAAQLQAAILEDIQQTPSASNIDASVLAQAYDNSKELDKKAEENHISRGKAALIDKIVKAGLADARGVPYAYETLAALGIHELKMILESKSTAVEGLEATGKAENTAHIGKEAALDIALTHAGLTRETVRDLEVEMDYERGVMVYSVEFETTETEFEYEIHAETGELVKVESEPRDRDDDDREDRQLAAESSEYIGAEKALEIAMAHSGLTREQAERLEIKLDRERGEIVYSVEFESVEGELEYEIHAKTGEILWTESEPHDHDDWDDAWDDDWDDDDDDWDDDDDDWDDDWDD